uniref:Uncharacterized protein n=1 Tax=Globodera rostochiensis TaxID=31243 RepID=A0A914ID00_GLORO
MGSGQLDSGQSDSEDNPTEVDNRTVDNPTPRGLAQTLNSHYKFRSPSTTLCQSFCQNNGGEDRHLEFGMERKKNVEKVAAIRAIYRNRANRPFLAYLKGLLTDYQNDLT